jgi:ABC-type transport system substrate-binding protein
MLAALVALVSVACGSDDAEEVAAPAAAAPAAAPAAAAPAPAAAPPAPAQAGSDITITMAIREVSEQFGDFEVQTYGGSPGELQMGYYDQLLVHDGTDPLSPFAASAWALNSAGDTLSMTIRDDLKCNTPEDFAGKDFGYVKAEDVAWNMDRQNAVVNPSLGAAIGAQLGGTFGSAVVTGEYTLDVPVVTKLTWGVPLSEFDINDTSVRLDCKQAFDQMGAEAIKFVPVGTGPWTIGEWLPNNRGDVHAVWDHWVEPPNIGTFTVIQVPDTSSRLAMMQTGEADIGEVDFGKLRELESKGLKFITTMSDKDTMTLSAIWPGNLWTDLNAKTEEALEPWLSPVYETDLPHLGCPWGDKCPYDDTDNPAGVSDMEQARLVRWALGMAIDREGIVDVLQGGLGTPIYLELMGPKFPGWDPTRTVNQAAINGYHEKYGNALLGDGTDWIEYDVPAVEPDYDWPWEIPTDLEEAGRLLDLAGYPVGSNGVRFEISLNKYACETGDVCLEQADAVAASWEQLGVKTTLLTEEYGAVVVPRMRDRTQPWPVVKNCSVETANYPLDWPPPPSDSTFSRPGWGCAFENKFLDFMYITINGEEDKSKREAMHLDMVDYYYYWQLYGGMVQPPRGVAANPETVDSWSSRSSAAGYWGRPQHIVPAK